MGIFSSIFGSSAKRKEARAIKKAGRKNYSLLMENVGMLEKDNMNKADLFAEKGEKFRSSQLQQYGMSGVRINTGGLEELDDYKLGVDEIDYEGNADKTVSYRMRKMGRVDEDEDRYTTATKTVKGSGAKQDTKDLKVALNNYEGKQTDFQGQGGSALLNMQTTTHNLQKDLSNTYQQGMNAVYMERRRAENALSQSNAQAAVANAQATSLLWGGLLDAAFSFVPTPTPKPGG